MDFKVGDEIRTGYYSELDKALGIAHWAWLNRRKGELLKELHTADLPAYFRIKEVNYPTQVTMKAGIGTPSRFNFINLAGVK